MRITGGRVRGRILATPRGLQIRPTSDRVREAIFNILGHDLAGFNVLDLFSGTGSLGLEALSRGAAYCVFIDKRQDSINLVNKNIALCGCQSSGMILRKDLTKGIPWEHAFLRRKFDLVFLDPPYAKNLAPPLVAEISSGDRLSAVARVVVESGKPENLPSSFSGLEMKDARVYGDTKISMYGWHPS